jgi:ketosteroid isomerase-like protein
MTFEHPHARVIRGLWEAAASGDANAVCELYGPGAVMRAHGRSPVSGEFKGPAVIVDYFGRLGELVDDLRSELLDIYTSDEGAIMRYRTVAQRGARHFDMEFLFVARIQDGRVLEADLIPSDQQRYDAFWA